MTEEKQHKRYHYTLHCKVCGKVFLSVNNNIATCSPECLQKFIANRKVFKKTCIVCGGNFQTQNIRKKYCSKHCKNQHYYHGDKVLIDARHKPTLSDVPRDYGEYSAKQTLEKSDADFRARLKAFKEKQRGDKR